MTTIHLDPAMVPAQLRGAYSGKKFQVRVCESMVIPAVAGLWDGGSRDLYSAIEIATGRNVELPGQKEAPWGNRAERNVTLQPGFAVVEHSIFCGKDMGLTFYVHPANAATLLPAPVELTAHEKIVLNATATFKSSYMGRDRYQMAARDFEWTRDTTNTTELQRKFPSRSEWNAAKEALIARGMLNKAGAITVSGRNAVRS